jgi:hypothetical protein
MKKNDFDNVILLLASSIDTKYTIRRNNNYRSIACEVKTDRHTALIKSCNVVFAFNTETNEFAGIQIEMEPNK